MDSPQRKGRVDFTVFNIPLIAQLFMPLDNEPEHGGPAETDSPPFQNSFKNIRDVNYKKTLVNYKLCERSHGAY
jgi:hypothetical protein